MIGKFAISPYFPRGNGKKTPKMPKIFFAGLCPAPHRGSRPGPRLGLRPRPQLGLAPQTPHPVTIIHARSAGAVAAPGFSAAIRSWVDYWSYRTRVSTSRLGNSSPKKSPAFPLPAHCPIGKPYRPER